MADSLLLLTFASYGLCHILMYGTILNKPRKWLTTRYNIINELLSCALCTGFWCGLILELNIIFGLYSAATCYIIHLITGILLDKSTDE
jgi:hypothetical protein